MTKREETDYWFEPILHPKKWCDVQVEIAKLSGVSTSQPIMLPDVLPSAGRILAKLTFGFWPHLYSRHYRDIWWAPSSPLLAQVIASHPNVTASTRSELHRRLMYFNELRNRAMHHEAIFEGISIPNHPAKPINTLHDELLETIGWINPIAARLLACLNRFPTVYDPASPAGRLGIRAAIQSEFNIP
ncbi:MAG: hypothetical protein IT336_15650 [Thermomicrobiales bacterium]|nr:hypothetical protein [Thermomicrobiales bacterium]